MPESIFNWAFQAKEEGLRVCSDEKGLTHIMFDPRFENFGTQCDVNKKVEADSLGDKICMHCRELPGREAHYNKVMEKLNVTSIP